MHNKYTYPPGTRLAVCVYGLRHEGVASDRFISGEQGVISSSRRAGCVDEEPLSVFSGGREIYMLEPLSNLHPSQVVANAQRAIGAEWDLLQANCQHFVCEAFGVERHSPQLWQAAAAGLLIAATVYAARNR